MITSARLSGGTGAGERTAAPSDTDGVDVEREDGFPRARTGSSWSRVGSSVVG